MLAYSWLRQPLLDQTAIIARQDIVELMANNMVCLQSLREGPLKAIPDLESVVNK